MKYKDTCILIHEKINFTKIQFEEISIDGGVLMDTKSQASFQEKAMELLHADADKIAQLIKVQMDNLTMPSCPLYEEVLDTQMFGLSREIDFAVKLGLIEREQGKQILDSLEKELSLLHDAYTDK